MNENILHSDTRLREAVIRREQQLPPMPADLNDRVLQRIAEQKPQPRRAWLYAAIAAAATVLLLLSLHYIYNNVEPEQKPIIAQHSSKTKTETEQNDMPAPTEETIAVAHAVVTKAPATVTAPQKPPKTHSQATEDLAACIARLEAEMESIDDSVGAAQLEQLIAADARLQQLVFRIVGRQTEQALNEIEKDSTANYINF